MVTTTSSVTGTDKPGDTRTGARNVVGTDTGTRRLVGKGPGDRATGDTDKQTNFIICFRMSYSGHITSHLLAS